MRGDRLNQDGKNLDMSISILNRNGSDSFIIARGYKSPAFTLATQAVASLQAPKLTNHVMAQS